MADEKLGLPEAAEKAREEIIIGLEQMLRDVEQMMKDAGKGTKLIEEMREDAQQLRGEVKKSLKAQKNFFEKYGNLLEKK